jgi:ornithine cyclodeaminase/alanine dehydrogenase-like protein (mu-crystallin family)
VKPPFEKLVPVLEATLAATAAGPLAVRAAMGAIASRFLAVGTPRSIGVIASGDAARFALEAHRVFFAPREVRSVADGASVQDACACDIVCVYEPAAIDPAWIRRGTHVDAIVDLPSELLAAAQIVVMGAAKLHEICAGFVDGRQLDEITVFVQPW